MTTLKLLSAAVLVDVTSVPCRWMFWILMRPLRFAAGKAGLEGVFLGLLWAAWFSLEATIFAAVSSGRYAFGAASSPVLNHLLVGACFAYVTFDKMELKVALLTQAPRSVDLVAPGAPSDPERQRLAAMLPYCWLCGVAVFCLSVGFRSFVFPPAELAAAGMAGLFGLRRVGFFVFLAGLIGLLGHGFRALMVARQALGAIRDSAAPRT